MGQPQNLNRVGHPSYAFYVEKKTFQIRWHFATRTITKSRRNFCLKYEIAVNKIKTLISGSPLHLLVIFNSKLNNFTSLARNYDLTFLAICFKPNAYMFRFLVLFKGPLYVV